jgi:hypothetical protein
MSCNTFCYAKCHFLQAHHKGVLIRRVEPTAPAHAAVGAYDILLSFDGIDISNDGTVPFRSGERISFSYLVSQVGKHNMYNTCVRCVTCRLTGWALAKTAPCVFGSGECISFSYLVSQVGMNKRVVIMVHN